VLAISATLALVVAGAGRLAGARPAPGAPTAPPNIVLILTDDQRFDELAFMPKLKADVIDAGVYFSPNAVISDPLCCPSRATILTGTYSHTNGIYANVGEYGGFQAFTDGGNDANTIATVLQSRGYRTGLVGKYLNGYLSPNAAYVPPGWDSWFAQFETGGETAYYNWQASNQGTLVSYGSDPASYSTTVFDQKALDFIRTTPAAQPLFLYVAPRAPHAPMIPAPQYEGSLAGQVPDITAQPNFNEADVSDKPQYVRDQHVISAGGAAGDQLQYEKQFETLLSVDDMIGDVVAELETEGRLKSTLLIFLSDQGVELGSHRLGGKQVPYEESIRTPMVVRWDALGVAPRIDASLVSNVDLAQTMAAAAGTAMPGAEGRSLLPLLKNPAAPWRKDLLLEHAIGDVPPAYCGVRTPAFMYAQYRTGEEELYELALDPGELTNVAADPGHAPILATMRAKAHVLCRPPPPGFRFQH
jgi:N-acetylglucosamine-6-sulfatase